MSQTCDAPGCTRPVGPGGLACTDHDTVTLTMTATPETWQALTADLKTTREER